MQTGKVAAHVEVAGNLSRVGDLESVGRAVAREDVGSQAERLPDGRIEVGEPREVSLRVGSFDPV